MTPWLTVIGIGEEGLQGLSPTAKAALNEAVLIAGGKRHLDFVQGMKAELYPWPSPLQAGFKHLERHRGQKVVVLATGDPLFYGIGSTLLRYFTSDELLILPHLSCFSLAASHLKWSLQECHCLSLHGRAFETVLPALQPNKKLMILSWDENTPARLAAFLCKKGCGESILHVLEAIGGPKERVRFCKASDFDFNDIEPLNMICLEVKAHLSHRLLPLAPGLTDDHFEHDGQITKSDIRAITLAALKPFRGKTLWDLGAGTGSVAIEWMLRHAAMRAIAIERDQEKTERIRRNAFALGVPDLEIICGKAPEALATLPKPDSIFIGGGCSQDTLTICQTHLQKGGIVVANAVTLETQALLMAAHKQEGGELLSISVSHAEPVGTLTGWRPSMPLMQWRWVKP